MAETVAGEGFTLTWSGEAVDVNRIESELTRLRYGAAGTPAGHESFAIRTNLLNLVVYTASEEAAAQASQTIAGLRGHHPSRALILVANPSEEAPQINARLAAHCHAGSALEQQVCCEEVILSVKGRAASHLHSIVIPLLIPDLPVYVWWTGPLPKGRHLFEEMMETADRFIVDSGRFRHPTHGLARIAKLCTESPDCAIGDMNWSRLAPWRELFERHSGTPDMLQHLGRVDRVEVRYAQGGEGGAPSGQVFLLLAWLALRFGWITESRELAGPNQLVLNAGNRAVSVELTAAQHAHAEPGSVLSLRLLSASEDAPASILIHRSADPNHVQIEVQNPDYQLNESVLIDPPETGDILARELDDLPGRHTDYEQVLELALPLVQALHIPD